jgi:ATP-dependent DNA ligase
MSVYNILVKLASTDSRLEKEAILKSEHDNKELKEVVRLALDSLTQFYIRKVPIVNQHAKKSAGLPWAFAQLKFLSTRKVTGNAGIVHLKNILEELDEADSLVVERIISKDLRCGVSTATANKIWPKLCHEFPCMLASPFKEKLVGKIKFPAIAQLKLDGMRATIIVENGAVTVYSRNGKIIDIADHFAKEILATGTEYTDVVFDGELLVVNEFGSFVNRQTGNGILNKALLGTITDEEVKDIRFVAFDMIPLQDFRKGVCHVPYFIRLNSLNTFIFVYNALEEIMAESNKKIQVVETWEVSSFDDAQGVFEDMIMAGQEGIILKDEYNMWENKRSKTLIKFKAELDCDLVCVDVVEGTGKYQDRMGALVLESVDGIIKVNVGTGFSDEDRQVLWENKPLGKIVAVCYNACIKDKNSGVNSLFLPRFLEVREDKSVADTSKVIK